MSKFVMVDCISTYRMRYCVELDDNDPKEWAMDTVVMEEAKEFSQEFLGEMIASHRVLSNKEEAFAMFREDVSDERLTEIGITLIEDYKTK